MINSVPAVVAGSEVEGRSDYYIDIVTDGSSLPRLEGLSARSEYIDTTKEEGKGI